jgi:putative transcriptional regulator
MSRDDHPGDPAEQAALYLAGALPPADQAAFEAHLEAGCPACRAELRDFGPAFAALVDSVEPAAPAPRTRATLLARVAADPRARQKESCPAHRRDEGRPVVRRAAEASWRDTPVPGLQVRILSIDRRAGRYAALMRMAPGGRFPAHHHDGPEECLVLEGDVRDGEITLHAGDYQYSPAGSDHGELTTEGGCLVYLSAPLSALAV